MNTTRNTVLKWLYPEGAAIIDAMLFTRALERIDDTLILHRRYIDSIHNTVIAPMIMFPHWHLFMREDGKPFMVSYPFGLNNKLPYNVRLVCDAWSVIRGHEGYYSSTIDIRYNLSATGHRSYHRLVKDKYENVQDYISLAASAQAAFHSIFSEQSQNPIFWATDDVKDSVSDYSAQNTVLPYYNNHNLVKGTKP